jgi:hypothetical protein
MNQGKVACERHRPTIPASNEALSRLVDVGCHIVMPAKQGPSHRGCFVDVEFDFWSTPKTPPRKLLLGHIQHPIRV